MISKAWNLMKSILIVILPWNPRRAMVRFYYKCWRQSLFLISLSQRLCWQPSAREMSPFRGSRHQAVSQSLLVHLPSVAASILPYKFVLRVPYSVQQIV
jgi:hypothetical protein